MVAYPAFNRKQNMPRNRTTKTSAFVQLTAELRKLKAEINPSVKTFKPSAQPSPIKAAVDGRWSYSRFRLIKTGTNNGGTVNVTTGEVADAIGLSKVDFQIDRVACWLMGAPEYQNSSLSWNSGIGLLPATLAFEVSDFGSSMRPPAVGIDLPRSLTVITNGAVS